MNTIPSLLPSINWLIGFGSMPASDPTVTTRLILEAHRRGWAKIGAVELTEMVFALDYAPYAWLFPHVAAVIHHGGSGTTGFALRSGVPWMVVPFTADQPFWGKRTHKLGVGPVLILFVKLSVEKLAAAITTRVLDRERSEQAAALGKMTAQEMAFSVLSNEFGGNLNHNYRQ